jgi:hypothetical protein
MLLDKTIICFSYFKYNSKSPFKGFGTGHCDFFDSKANQGIAIANYLTDNIHFYLQKPDDSKCNRSSLDYSFIKIFKNNADLESKAYFLHYIAENIQ